MAGEVERVTISNVEPRRDMRGNIIDAHDGCVEQFGERFYLYGTQYRDTDGYDLQHRYVCYSSPDLTNWTFHGELVPGLPDNLYYRPYVKYNAKTKKYVLWYHFWNQGSAGEGGYHVATSDTPEGPFTTVRRNVEVKMKVPGDHGLFVDDDGTGYLIYTTLKSARHGISVERLMDDYLGSTFENSGVIGEHSETPALFKRGDIYYALFDNTCTFCTEGTGARVYTAESPLGPYTYRGNINRAGDPMRPSGPTVAGHGRLDAIIKAQQTHIARIRTGSGVHYIWMGDLWGSTPDGRKGHDFQYWSSPLEFDEDGMIRQLVWEDEWSLDL